MNLWKECSEGKKKQQNRGDKAIIDYKKMEEFNFHGASINFIFKTFGAKKSTIRANNDSTFKYFAIMPP